MSRYLKKGFLTRYTSAIGFSTPAYMVNIYNKLFDLDIWVKVMSEGHLKKHLNTKHIPTEFQVTDANSSKVMLFYLFDLHNFIKFVGTGQENDLFNVMHLCNKFQYTSMKGSNVIEMKNANSGPFDMVDSTKTFFMSITFEPFMLVY